MNTQDDILVQEGHDHLVLGIKLGPREELWALYG